MLSKALNKAHILDRQSQSCVKRGLLDRAISLQHEIITNLEEAYLETTNSRARQSIALQKTRHLAALSRLEQKAAIRDKARQDIQADLKDMTSAPDFSSKSSPVLTSPLAANITDKDRLIMRLQERISLLSSKLEQCQAENIQLKQRVRDLESTQAVSHQTSVAHPVTTSSPHLLSPGTSHLLSPDHSSSYHHVTHPPAVHGQSAVGGIQDNSADQFTLTPLEQPPDIF